jgi:D-arabinose 1-dehydrogenase-like Zn-dependent alcohol dehydrogenase
MASFGTIYPVTVEFGNISFPALPALLKSLAFRPCTNGSHLMVLQMLEFAVRHGIKAKIEKFPLNEDGLMAAQERLLKGGVKYKAVMEVKV